MTEQRTFHLVTVGWSPSLVRNLWSRVAHRGGLQISHIAHPSFDRSSWGESMSGRVYFLRDTIADRLPSPDCELLASLEQEGVPTIHNMLMGDRFLSRLPYSEGLAYASMLAQRLQSLYREIRPSAVVGGFDGLEGSLGFAVARRLGIPWFAMYFSSLPSGRVALCSDLSPASMVTFKAHGRAELRVEAERLLRDFEERKVQAFAYIPPQLLSLSFMLRQLPVQLRALLRILSRRRLREHLKYTDYAGSYSASTKIREALRARWNLWSLHRRRLPTTPSKKRYAFFGLHMQPESSIDVHAHFFSNQVRVVELMARSLPPTHTLYVKPHKSDASNYSPQRLAQLARFPGVQLISPYADTIEFIKHADLVFSIQGTIGLEAAMLGKPVVMFGESPVRNFPSVSTVGKTIELPRLVRDKLSERSPGRPAIVEALAGYLTWFHPASVNDWTLTPSDSQIDRYVEVFRLLQQHVEEQDAGLEHQRTAS
jgi:capsular polysaccharide biosynthesis protein